MLDAFMDDTCPLEPLVNTDDVMTFFFALLLHIRELAACRKHLGPYLVFSCVFALFGNDGALALSLVYLGAIARACA